ncbi:MAG: threonylcarbamoyl-AMP synthase [Deltaproteobacteria bacterium]|nr:threonylcarbamoyl-AMP synthase [Deltaproteobacteria bacterium]MBW2378690.1 threonylcarbamoyl-AMP synthase [Deltaproteobacteria bacterium]MBW2685196.1 threonylcarbamoyl-AMP synthase [Deltaproteobacteria bacterium]RLB40643.1 MAG: threonylcarbamoyl-AMP synthase [Deltaproteobacteria bacterium]
MTDLAAVVEVLRQGGVVACPTETWLGLLADARSETALQRVAELKGRPADMPIALLLPDARAAAEVASPPSAAARALMEAYWPGPLTILLEAKLGLNPRLTRDGKVGVRVPGPSPAADLVRAFGYPLTATSANRTGEPPLRSADELPVAFAKGVDGAVSGVSPGGAPSTLIDATASPMQILRVGAIDIDPAAL